MMGRPGLFSIMSELKQDLKFYLNALGTAARNFVWDDCLTVSASISFVFLLAIIPFSALFLFFLNLFQNTFLPGFFPENMVDILIDDITHLIPFISKQWVQTHLIESVGMRSFTTINLLMLPIISGLLFKSLEESFRRIFDLERRSIIKGQVVYAMMSIFAILLFFMANFVWTILSETARLLEALAREAPYVHDVYVVVLKIFSWPHTGIISAVILIGFFLITIRIFIGLPIKWRHRLVGGVVFGLLWLAAREIFGVYIRYVTRINVLFGSMSSVCIILLWIFYSAIALLYSVEYMHVLHRGQFHVWRRPIRLRSAK
jgi:YihY family inner membrane protein